MAIVLKDVCGNAHFKKGVWEKPCLSQQSPEFVSKLVKVATGLGMDPNWLAAVIAFESGFNPKATNPDSLATGLIQFMPKSTAPSLGTSRDKLLAMSEVEQLDYVDKYFRNKDTGLPLRKFKSLNDVYLSVYRPDLLGKSSDFVVARSGSKEYAWNKFDRDNKGYYTVSDVMSPVTWLLSSAEKKMGVTVSDAIAISAIGVAAWFGVLAGGYLAWRKNRKKKGLPVPL